MGRGRRRPAGPGAHVAHVAVAAGSGAAPPERDPGRGRGRRRWLAVSGERRRRGGGGPSGGGGCRSGAGGVLAGEEPGRRASAEEAETELGLPWRLGHGGSGRRRTCEEGDGGEVREEM